MTQLGWSEGGEGLTELTHSMELAVKVSHLERQSNWTASTQNSANHMQFNGDQTFPIQV